MIEILQIILGILLGLLAILPGYHINNVVPTLSKIFPQIISPMFILLFAIVQNYAEFIKATIFRIPTSDDIFTTLLARKRDLKKIFEYATLSIYFLIFLLPLTIFLLKNIYISIKEFLFYILIVFYVLFVLKSIKNKYDLICFILSGFFGIIILKFLYLKDPFIVLLPSLFGLPEFFVGDERGIQNNIRVKKYDNIIISLVISYFSCLLLGLLPATSPSVVFLIIYSLFPFLNPLLLLAFLNVGDIIISFIMYYLFGKSRLGALDYIEKLSFNELLFATSILSFVLPAILFLMEILSRMIIEIYVKYENILKKVLFVFVTLLVVYLNNIFALLPFFSCLLLGIYGNKKNINKVVFMNSIYFPLLFYYLSF